MKEETEYEEILWSISEIQQPLSDLESYFLAALIEHLAKKTGEKYEKILDVPCGWGRHHKLLREKGFEVHGLDLSEKLIKKAKQLYKAFEQCYVVGNMKDLPYVDGNFDVVLNLFTSFGYMEEEENKKCLQEFHRVLRVGGIYILETINGSWVRCFFRPMDVEEVGEYLLITKRNWDGNYQVWRRTLFRKGSMKKINSLEIKLRIYSKEELDRLAQEIGFKPLLALSGLSAIPFRPTSPRLLLIYQKL